MQAGDIRIHLQFHEAIPYNEIQNMTVVAIRPSSLEIDADRKIKMSRDR